MSVQDLGGSSNPVSVFQTTSSIQDVLVSNFKTVRLVSFAYHACGDGVVGGFVYQDKRAEGVVFFVGRGGDRLLGFEADAADVKNRPNAAGKYSTFGFGCGTSGCIEAGAIDNTTGTPIQLGNLLLGSL